MFTYSHAAGRPPLSNAPPDRTPNATSARCVIRDLRDTRLLGAISKGTQVQTEHRPSWALSFV